MRQRWTATQLVWILLAAAFSSQSATAEILVRVKIDRGADLGQCFGSLCEARTDDNSLVVGAGFQNAYNTRYRADRHAIQFITDQASRNSSSQAIWTASNFFSLKVSAPPPDQSARA